MVLNIAHRGFSADYPQNTLLAFEKALALGVTWLELDLQVTRDGHLVVIHNKTVDATTDGEGDVSDLDLTDVKALDAGIGKNPKFRGERIPTFAEVLDQLGPRAMLVVELKFDGLDHVQTALNAVANRGLAERVMISSFHLKKIPWVKTLAPEAAVTALHKPRGLPAQKLVDLTLDLGADTIGPLCSEIDTDLVQNAHDAGLLVRAWGLGRDQGEEMTRLIDLGVDGMTTDCPDILQRILRERGIDK